MGGHAALGSTLAHALAAGYLVTMMFSMGLELGGRPKGPKQEKRHERRLLLRGLAFNLLLLPLVAFTLSRLLHAGDEVETAFLILAAAPGGRYAPMLARLARAELSLSVEITLFLAKLTAFTAPPTLQLLLQTHHVDLPELRLIAQLAVLQMLPLFAGKMIRRHRPAFAARLDRPVRALSLVCVALIVIFLVIHREIRSVLFIGVRGWLAALSFAAAALGIGWLLGGRSEEARRSMALSGNSRDVALALMVASLVFSGGVQLAVFGEWMVFLAFNLIFAALVGRRTQGLGAGVALPRAPA